MTQPSPKSRTAQPVTSGAPIKACPRFETTTNGTVLDPGVTMSGVQFSSNLSIQHEVVLLDSTGSVVSTAVITPATVTPTGGPPAVGTVSVMVPTGTAAGTYYLQVRIPPPDTAANYTHTVEITVPEGTPPPGPDAIAEPAPGSEPGTYPVGTWIILNAVVTGGVAPFEYDWLLNGMGGMGSAAGFSFQMILGAVTAAVGVKDADGATATSPALAYTGVPAGTFRVVNFRREPATNPIPVGTSVEFFATFADGTPDYSCEVAADPSTLLPTVTTAATTEVSVGTFTYAAVGTFTAVLMARDSAGATDSPTVAVDVVP